MQSTLFTELSLSEQEKLSGGQNFLLGALQLNVNVNPQIATAAGVGVLGDGEATAENESDTDQFNGIFQFS